jgi:hypothetical protein
MKQQTETQEEAQPIWEDCIEYFIGEGCEFKFCYSEAQTPTAEELVREVNEDE